LEASPKMARERSAGSEIAANVDGGCNVLEGCAEPEVDPAARMSPHAFVDARQLSGVTEQAEPPRVRIKGSPNEEV